MELYINSEKISFTLENEEFVSEIISSIKKDALKNNSIITGIEIDGKIYDPDDENLKKIRICEVDKIDIEIDTREQVMLSILGECEKYIFNIAEDINNNFLLNKAKYLELFNWINESLNLISQNVVNIKNELNIIITSLSNIRKIIENLNEVDNNKLNNIKSALIGCAELLEVLEVKVSGIFDISRKDLVLLIEDGIKILPQISIAFQTGKDAEAFDKISKIVSILELCLIFIKNNKRLIEKYKDESVTINGILEEIINAFENKDYVLIGDLMEYELPEKLSIMKKIINENE